MDVYNSAIKYLKDTFGEKNGGATTLSCNGSKKFRQAHNNKEREKILLDETNYAPVSYNVPKEDNYNDYLIHLLVTQYQYDPILIGKELAYALFLVGIDIKDEKSLCD